jgi:dATP/dGTP diphosphohydrolase, N-terminal
MNRKPCFANNESDCMQVGHCIPECTETWEECEYGGKSATLGIWDRIRDQYDRQCNCLHSSMIMQQDIPQCDRCGRSYRRMAVEPNDDNSKDASIGVKHDANKPRMDLLPSGALIGAARVMTAGLEKYDPRNWERGLLWGSVYGAAQRHMTAFWNGEDIDPESGLSHLHHAQCCLMFLAEYQARPALFGRFDDRSHLPKEEAMVAAPVETVAD